MQRNAVRVIGNIFIIIILLLLSAAAFELVARIIDNSKIQASSQRDTRQFSKETINKIVNNLIIAFDGEYTYDKILKMFPLVQDRLKYKPWVQIGNIDHNNPFSVVEKGIRETYKSKKCNDSEKKPKIVWFYGGSTTYGMGVPWWNTIPSNFVERADRSDICVVAVNFGVPYHFSRQEAIYFATNLMNEPAPDMVVFVDGLNEFYEAGSSIRSEPFFTPKLDKLVSIDPNPTADTTGAAPSLSSKLSRFISNLHMLRWLSWGAVDPQMEREEAYSNRNPPQSQKLQTDEQVAKAIVDRYLATRRFISKLCDSYETRCFQFLQPVAAVDYTPQASEIVSEEARRQPEPANRYAAGYASMRKIFRSSDAGCDAERKGLESLDLSSLFKSYDGIPYVDYGHYAPRANKRIAEEIFRCVFAEP